MINDDTLSKALRYYPQYWTRWQNSREMVIESYAPSLSCATGSPSIAMRYKDPASAAVALVAIDYNYRLWDIIRRWIDLELPPQYRSLLIDVWRGYSWQRLAAKYREDKERLIESWDILIRTRLSPYVADVFLKDGGKYG